MAEWALVALEGGEDDAALLRLVTVLKEVARHESSLADPAHYTFVDIGCGRGFVLLNALKRRYKRIIGIELAPQIAAEARANVDAYGRRHGLAGSVEIVVGDATTWELPCEPSVIYFYNPFSREIFEKMRRRLEESLRRDPRDMYVVYAFPESREVFDDSPAFDAISSRKHYVVYRSKPNLGDRPVTIGESVVSRR